MKRFIIFLFWTGFIPVLSYGQISINGIVSDASNSEALAGAHILLENTFIATISTATGQFRIAGLKPGLYQLRASYVGYETYSASFQLNKDTIINIAFEPSAIMGSEVIVSATRAGLNSPTTYSTLANREIERINLGQDMPYLLQSTPSVVTTSDAGTGIGYSSLRIRGTDLTRINVTINGIPLNDAESHGVWWVDLPDFASSAENIQIQRGVGTSTNGAAAFGASINIRSDDPEAYPYGEVNASAGSFGTYKLTFKTGTGLIKKNWAFDGRFSKIYSQGYIDRAFADLFSYSLSGGYYGRKSVIRLMVMSGAEETYQAWDGVPGYMLDTNRTYNGLGAYFDDEGNLRYYANQTDNYRQTHYHLNWIQHLSERWNATAALHYTRGKGYYEEYKTDQELSDYQLDIIVIGSDTITSTDLIRRRWLDNHFYGLTFSFNYDDKKKIKATIAGALNHYQGDHYGEIIWSEFALGFDKNYRWYENRSGKTDANVYSKVNWQISDKINLYGDLQLRSIIYSIEGTDNDLRDISQDHIFTFFNPKLGAYYEINERNQAYLSFAIGNREPNRSTLIDANPARPLPTSERLYNMEGGYKFSSRAVSVTANLFWMQYRDQLVLTGRINDVGDPVMENVNKSYRAGLETILSLNICKKLKWDLNLTLSSNRIIGFTEYIDNWDEYPDQLTRDLGITDLAFSPAVTGSSVLAWEPFRDLSISLYSKYVGKQYIDNTTSNERKLDPYLVNDLLISYAFKVKNMERLGLSLKINNITNAKYETNAWIYRYYSEGLFSVYDGYFPQARINFLAGIDLKF